MSLLRTITPSQLRDPDVLAEAALQPVNIFDAKRDTELIMGSKAAWDTDQRLLNTYSLLLANAVVELPDEQPSPVALGALGFAASWPLPDRLWLLRQLAEVYAASVRLETVAPIVDFIEFMGRQPGNKPSARIAAPVEFEALPPVLQSKLLPRSA
jgi:hypothetical protein